MKKHSTAVYGSDVTSVHGPCKGLISICWLNDECTEHGCYNRAEVSLRISVLLLSLFRKQTFQAQLESLRYQWPRRSHTSWPP
jgi:hypothetical protein